MNERYLFRGKRIDNGEWVTGYYLPRRYSFRSEEPLMNVIVVLQGKSGIADLLIEVNVATVGQSTGLRDRNGTLIFEGDIVKDSYERTFYVKFSIHFLQMQLYPINEQACKEISKEYGVGIFNWVFPAMCLRVFGNVHDTPELLLEAQA